MKYNLVVCGGTFDHFHQGHASFLKAALDVSQNVLIGITADAYAQQHKTHAQELQSFQERETAVKDFLTTINALSRATIAPIDSVFYPNEWESLPIEAIVTTEETKKGAEIINQDRMQKGLSPLTVFIVPFVSDDTGEKIASTNIRQGKINDQGISYVQQSWFAQDLFLPEAQREWFQKPFGELHRDNTFLANEDPQKVVTVGDVVTQDCNSMGFTQKLSVIDFTIQRKPTHTTIASLGFSGQETVYHVKNPAGHITTELFHSLMDAITGFSAKKQFVIVVSGEEDLSVIPLVLALPLGFVVIYGQPNQGVVRLPVTSEAKNKAYNLLKRLVVSKN